MSSPGITFTPAPHLLQDDVRLQFGNGPDAAIVYDSAAAELTLQTADASGALTDRLKIDAGTNTPGIDVAGMDLAGIGAGAVGAPSIAFAGDPDTGVWSSAADIVNISAGGAEIAEFDSAGVDLAADLRLADGSGVVIGHSAQLTLNGNLPELQILGTGGADTMMAVGGFNAPPVFAFLRSRNTAIGAASAKVESGDNAGVMMWLVDDSTDYDSEVARIFAEVDGVTGADDTPGRLIFRTTADSAETSTERLRIDSSGRVLVNETANANQTIGLTINQGASDNEILSLKSSDIAHGVTGVAETDTYGLFKKDLALTGALAIVGLTDSGATGMSLHGVATAPSTTHAAGASGIVRVQASKKSGASIVDPALDEVLFSIESGATGATSRFLVDWEGDIFADGGTSSSTMVTQYDDFADAELVRAFDIARHSNGAGGYIRSQWDRHVRYNEETLVELGILGAPLDEGGLVNVTRLQQLHNGAIWQLYTEHRELENEVKALRSTVLALTPSA